MYLSPYLKKIFFKILNKVQGSLHTMMILMRGGNHQNYIEGHMYTYVDKNVFISTHNKQELDQIGNWGVKWAKENLSKTRFIL